jgi:Acetyltransferase (GNAT) family
VTVTSQARDVSAAVLASGDEEALAALRRRMGHRVLTHRGRYWTEAPRGFYQPIHWLARLRADEATAPRSLAWGFRATLRDDDGGSHGNGTLPVHLLTDVSGYAYEALGRRHRRDLRTCAKRATIVELTGPELLREQGFEVRRSAVKRTGYGEDPSREQYLAGLDHFFGTDSRLVLAGIVDGGLGGYITGTAVHGTAYIDNVWIATEALRSAIGTGLVFEFVQACRRGGGIREVAFGLDSAEDRSLVEFKERLGFPVRLVPARVRINPLLAPIVRRRHPYQYYRLTGAAPTTTTQ